MITVVSLSPPGTWSSSIPLAERLLSEALHLVFVLEVPLYSRKRFPTYARVPFAAMLTCDHFTISECPVCLIGLF